MIIIYENVIGCSQQANCSSGSQYSNSFCPKDGMGLKLVEQKHTVLRHSGYLYNAIFGCFVQPVA